MRNARVLRRSLSVSALVILTLLALTSSCFAADGPWAWAYSGTTPGTVTLSDGTSADPSLHYELSGDAARHETQWYLRTTATSTRTITLDWEYSGNYGSTNGGDAYVGLAVWRGEGFTTYGVWGTNQPGTFSASGVYSLDVQAGDTYGFILGGWSNDGYMSGTLVVHPPDYWHGEGPGTVTMSTGIGADPSLHYELTGDEVFATQWWKLFTTATATRTVTLAWNYSGHHAWYDTWATLEAFVEREGVLQQVTIRDQSVWNGFDWSGIYTFAVQQGDIYGFRFGGDNFDAQRFLRGTLVVHSPRVYLPLMRTGS